MPSAETYQPSHAEEIAATVEQLAPLERGTFVRNIHPCNRGRMEDGIVTGTVDELGMIAVQVGTGSHVYGPARHWERISTWPDWSTPERLEEAPPTGASTQRSNNRS